MASLKTKQQKRTDAPATIRSLSIAPGDARMLDGLAQDASDYIGWTVSGSAIVRALLRYATQQDGTWCKEQLFSIIKHEIQNGTVWGKKRRVLTTIGK